MITLYVPIEVDGKPEYKEISGGEGNTDLDTVINYAYNLKIYNDALKARNKELENAYGCENCSGNPMNKPIDPRIIRMAAQAVMRDFPSWATKKK